MGDPITPNPVPLSPLLKTWTHSPGGLGGNRSEIEPYQLPRNEVLPWLIAQTDFMHDSSSQANDAYREVIHKAQYPRLNDPIEPRPEVPPSQWSAEQARNNIESFVNNYSRTHLDQRTIAVGFTPVLADHVYSDGVVRLPNAIMLGLPMRFAETCAAPKPAAGEEVTRNYMELGGLTIALAEHLRAAGYSAEPHHPRGNADAECEAMFVPHAIAAGLGDLGRHGSMISRDFGPRVRLSMVTTDAPIPHSSGTRNTGIPEFCTWCTKCLDACPVNAIAPQRITVRGSYRHIVDTSACLPYFAKTDGCGICIAVCPYNKPDEDRANAFADDVLRIGWVREAIAIKERDGVIAMERFVETEKNRRTR